MILTMLGTGNALVTECYNTCFVLSENGRHFLIDGGGGSTLLRQLKHANLAWSEMRDIFVTHKHLDHLTGIVWMMRMICQHMNEGSYLGGANIYGHDEVLLLLRELAEKLLPAKETRFIGDRLLLIPVEDGETREILHHPVTFFDIQSSKMKQYGFTLALDSTARLTCCGDEPYKPCLAPYAEKSKWLLHEAFCLSSQADLFHPYEKHHSTAKDACILAEQLGVENLLLYHTEDSDLPHRKQRYLAEGAPYFHGNIFIPDDLEVIPL